jgi:hypothetical protein
VLIPGSIISVAIAGLFASYVSNAVIELSVGAIGLGFVFYTCLLKWLRPGLMHPGGKPTRPRPGMGLLWGALSDGIIL